MNPDRIDLILLRGAPGSGKSSLGRRIRKKFPNGFLVEVDDVRNMINSVLWVNSEEHINALKATVALVRSYLAAGYRPAIIVDTLNPGKLRQILADLPEFYHLIISLFVSEAELARRLENRESGYRDFFNSSILNSEIGSNRYPNEFFVDTTNLTKAEVLEQVMTYLNEITDV